jgi:hypothetical protein
MRARWFDVRVSIAFGVLMTFFRLIEIGLGLHGALWMRVEAEEPEWGGNGKATSE